MKIKKFSDFSAIHDSAVVKCTDMGNFKEVMYCYKVKKQFETRRISKDEYEDLRTGEVFKVKHSENRSENMDGLRKTFKKLRNKINYNFSGADNELCFTLTYAENMTDVDKLCRDFQIFMIKLRRKYGKVEYMNIVEPQARGAWHCHVLLKFLEKENIFIPNADIAKMWGKGFVTVKSIRKDVDNLGAYLSAYLGDVAFDEIDEEYYKTHYADGRYEFKEVEADGQKKKFIKGGRLHMYPVGMQICRCSRGIKEPETVEIKYGELKGDFDGMQKTFAKTVVIADNDDKIQNTICYEHYKIKEKGGNKK